ncbi:MAG: CGLD27 family protein [Cyanobacteria bacterium]|jgi:hypothetical protein|nr:CGLD27 family protein [Cyanobacteriota bacterium]MDA1170479.1 CGLD27 family protein [Cyanobacteriota bacterium]
MSVCPVPQEQRPLQEYQQLCESWFFRWPTHSLAGLVAALGGGWILLLPIAIIVATGSVPLRHNPVQLVTAAAVAALLLPLLLLTRQWLGWSYVQRRLVREKIIYEESGWYDGQEWEKPLDWRQQDLLVAQHQVKPILVRLGQALTLLLVLLCFGSSICQAL